MLGRARDVRAARPRRRRPSRRPAGPPSASGPSTCLMRPARTPDVVVIGSGIGGLSAAALLAHAGRKVLVVEQADSPGGYAHSFKRGPYTFDPAISVFPQGHDDALPVAVLDYLGVHDRCRFLPLESNYRAVFPDFEITTRSGSTSSSMCTAGAVSGWRRPAPEYPTSAGSSTRRPTSSPQLGLAGLDEAARRFPCSSSTSSRRRRRGSTTTSTIRF